MYRSRGVLAANICFGVDDFVCCRCFQRVATFEYNSLNLIVGQAIMIVRLSFFSAVA